MVAIAVVAVLLIACGKRDGKLPSATGQLPPAQASLAERVRVLNGDVLVIDEKHVRLAGAYAPQGLPDARCWAEALAAKQVTETLRRMVQTGHSIRMEPTGGQDNFGRTYAKVILNGVDLGDTLYQDGLVAKTPGSFGWCQPVSLQAPGAPQINTVMDVGG
jgi:hypothetical protein